MTSEQICPECGIVVYEFKDFIATVRNHKPTCSKNKKEGPQYFMKGDKVRRKKEYQDGWWKYGDQVFTVGFCGPKSPEIFMMEDGQLDEHECNVFEWKRFERVVNDGQNRTG